MGGAVGRGRDHSIELTDHDKAQGGVLPFLAQLGFHHGQKLGHVILGPFLALHAPQPDHPAVGAVGQAEPALAPAQVGEEVLPCLGQFLGLHPLGVVSDAAIGHARADPAAVGGRHVRCRGGEIGQHAQVHEPVERLEIGYGAPGAQQDIGDQAPVLEGDQGLDGAVIAPRPGIVDLDLGIARIERGGQHIELVGVPGAEDTHGFFFGRAFGPGRRRLQFLVQPFEDGGIEFQLLEHGPGGLGQLRGVHGRGHRHGKDKRHCHEQCRDA